MRISTSRLLERARLLAGLGMPPRQWRVLALRRWLDRYRSIMAMDVSEFSELLSTHYGKESIEAAAARPNPTLRLLSKEPRQ